jgi:hypothetical protein
MDRVVRWVDFEHGRSGGDPVHESRLRPTGMVVFATVDGPARRRRGAVSTPAAPPEQNVLLRCAGRSVAWLLGR